MRGGDPAEAAVSRAVNCIWDKAHISFDLIRVSDSPAGEKEKNTGKKMTTEHFQGVQVERSLLQLLRIQDQITDISPKLI